MTKFGIKRAMNPVEACFTATDAEGQNPITLKLRPSDTAFAFDGSRWQTLVRGGRIDDANELQFQIGLNRIQGWQGVFDEDGSEVEFNNDNFAAWTRLVESIPYIMKAGEETLKEVKALPENFQSTSAVGGNVVAPKAELMCEARVIPGEPTPEPETSGEASESNTETPS